MQDMMKVDGDAVCYYRRRIGVQQYRLAELAGLEPSKLSRALCGRCALPREVVERLAHVLGVAVERIRAGAVVEPEAIAS